MATVSFVLFAYNQERFIQEALEGALEQTHDELEIVLSDDCSSDGTFEIMRERVAAYRGPHRVVLNRNERNLGLVAHYNRVCGLATGRLLVFAAGDDRSEPHRARRIVDAWRGAGMPREAVFYSLAQRMTEAGEPYPRAGEGFGHRQPEDPAELLTEWGGFVIGATMAVTRGLLERFGPLLPNLPCEDIPTLWRGALCGNLHFIDDALVRWRTGGTGIWSGVYGCVATPDERLARMRRHVVERAALIPQARADVAVVGASPTVAAAIRRFDEETAAALACVERSPWNFLGLFLRRWLAQRRVSHALRECAVEKIRIARAQGQNRGLAAVMEGVARVHAGVIRHRPAVARNAMASTLRS